MSQIILPLLFFSGGLLTLASLTDILSDFSIMPRHEAQRAHLVQKSRTHVLSIWIGNLRTGIPRRRLIYSLSGMCLGLMTIFGKPISDWDISIQMLIVLLFAMLGYRLPSILDESHKKETRREIETDLPGIIDLLVIMMDAGATFDDALIRVLSDDYYRNRAIKRDLSQLASELALSPDRQSAFQKFSYSAQFDAMRHFSSVLIQSELYGTPVAKGLRSLVLEMRQKQFSDIEAKSGALGPKLTVPMTLFFLPLIFIIVLAPTLIRALKLS